MLYSGEFTSAVTGLQYLRARFYDPSSGRFNRLDPFSGNTSDPLSLHKYLYTHANPVMGVDPTGMFSVTNLLVNTAISAIIGYIARPIVQPAASLLAQALIPDWAFSIAASSIPDALMVGVGVTGSVKLPRIPVLALQGTSTLELLVSPHTRNKALYWSWGLGANLSRRPQTEATVAAQLGLVWNADSSFDYRGYFGSITVPFRNLQEPFRRRFANRLTTLLMSPSLLSATEFDAAAKVWGLGKSVVYQMDKILDAQSKALQILSKLDNLSATFFTGGSGSAAFGFSVGYDLYSAKPEAPLIAINAYMQYYQIAPWKKDVQF